MHFIMSVCGGFLGGYAVFGRMAVFGSAQTANLIELVGDILGRNTTDALLRFGALVLYIAAMVIFSVMSKKTAWNLKYLVLLVDTAAVAVLEHNAGENGSGAGALSGIFCNVISVVRI